MANYAASVLAEAKLILQNRWAGPEKRLKNAGVLGAFLKNSSIAIPNLGELRTKEERAEKGYFFNRSKRTPTASRTFNHTGAVGDSSEVTFSWTTYTDVAQTSLKRSDNNLFSDAQILANEMDNILKNIYEDIDGDALAYLGTNKTQVNAATKNGVFDTNGSRFTFEIANANIARFLQMGKSMLRQNWYRGEAEAILDPVLYVEAEHLASQGAGNATNYGYQFSGLNLFEGVTLADANYPDGAGYLIPSGTIGIVDWIPRQNRQGYGNLESYVGGFSSMTDPRTGWNLAIHGYQQRADTSAAGGDTQDVVMEWEVSVDISMNNSPLSVANESTIFEIGMIDTPADAP